MRTLQRKSRKCYNPYTTVVGGMERVQLVHDLPETAFVEWHIFEDNDGWTADLNKKVGDAETRRRAEDLFDELGRPGMTRDQVIRYLEKRARQMVAAGRFHTVEILDEEGGSVNAFQIVFYTDVESDR